MRKIIFLLIALCTLVGLFVFLKPQSEQILTPSPLPSPIVAEKSFEIIVEGGKVTGGETLEATLGDMVVIKITGDQADELHIHGYNKSLTMEKDKEAEIRFTANLTGRFEIELHKSHTFVGALEVRPKQ